MKCFWCHKETVLHKHEVNESNELADEEHIFPESVDGIKKLPKGLICKKCNGHLGKKVDRYLKKGNFMFMLRYQDGDEIPGKKRKGKDRIRKINEKTYLKHYTSDTKSIRRDGVKVLSNLSHGSQGDFSYDRNFSKALHKCAINSIAARK
jgi:hypothetical protein